MPRRTYDGYVFEGEEFEGKDERSLVYQRCGAGGTRVYTSVLRIECLRMKVIGTVNVVKRDTGATRLGGRNAAWIQKHNWDDRLPLSSKCRAVCDFNAFPALPLNID